MNDRLLQDQPRELWRWTASALAHGIRTRAISARDVTSACLQHIEEVNPTINAFVEVSEQETLASADQSDRAVAAGAMLGPLHGIPVSIKVNSDQRGHATTNGVAAFKDALAKEDGPHVANLRHAGAIFLGRSNTPAFSYRWFTANELHGKTLNPWDASRTPGGSSGGAAAAAATGMVSIALGNDIGGSIRQPAYCCGVTGLRPTGGRIPTGRIRQALARLSGRGHHRGGDLRRHRGRLSGALLGRADWSPSGSEPFPLSSPASAHHRGRAAPEWSAA